jgi:2-methylcitrate dehydratase PrpD
VDEIAFKRHASCYRALAVIECILSLRRRLPHGIEKVDSIRCRVPSIALDHAGIIIPKNGLEAKFSQPFCAAVALVEGKAMEEQFTDKLTKDPGLLRLRGKTTVDVDDALHPAEANVEVALGDGTVYTEQIDIEKAQPPRENILADLKEKFQLLVSKSMTEEKSRILLDSVMTLEEVKDFRKIIELCS